MSLLFAVLVIVVIGGIVVVAVGGGGDAVAMSEEPVDRPVPRLPDDRPLSGTDLRAVRFGTALRGYRASDVDDLLERLARQLDEARTGGGAGGAPEDGGVAGDGVAAARAPYEEPPPVR